MNTGPMLTRIKLKVEYGDYVNISLADVGYHNQVAVIIDECITPATCALNVHYWFQIEVLSWEKCIKSIVLEYVNTHISRDFFLNIKLLYCSQFNKSTYTYFIQLQNMTILHLKKPYTIWHALYLYSLDFLFSYMNQHTFYRISAMYQLKLSTKV